MTDVVRDGVILRFHGTEVIRFEESDRVTVTPWMRYLMDTFAEACGCSVQDVAHHQMMMIDLGATESVLPYPLLRLLVREGNASEVELGCSVLESILESEPELLNGPWECRKLPSEPEQAWKDLEDWMAESPEPSLDPSIRRALGDALGARWGQLVKFKAELEAHYGATEKERIAAGSARAAAVETLQACAVAARWAVKRGGGTE
jgi:hypothetical protein